MADFFSRWLALSEALSLRPARRRADGDTRAAPAIGHFPGDTYGLRVSWDVSLWVGLAQQDLWPGRGGLCGAGDCPCCGIDRAGADGPGG